MIKKRTIQRIMLMFAFVLAGGWAAAELVDNFDSYATGAIDETSGPTNPTGGKWIENPVHTTATVTISTDPSNASNKVLGIRNNADVVTSGQVGVYGILTGNAIVTQAQTKTLFFKAYPTNVATDTAFGFCADNAPTGWANMPAYCAFVQGNFRARNAGTNTNIGTFVANTWYYVWIVVNNVANTYDVYFKNTAADATVTDRVATNFAFRTGAADGDLDRVFAMCNNGSFNGTSYYTTTLYFDDINISDGTNLTIPAGLGASNPSPVNGATDVLTTATLSWNTGINPANPGQPNPAITKHYISFRKGDPNLAYPVHTTLAEVNAAGATGSWTPPTTGLNVMAFDGTYYWRIDESVNNSSRTEPNTIRGSLWSFAAQKSIPVITQQPADVRVFASGPNADPNAVFTVTYTSINLPAATWYKNGVAIIPDGVNVKVDTTMTSSKLEIKTPEELSVSEGKYYCVLSVDPAITTDDVQSATRLLVIKKTLAQFDFENNLNDSSGNSAPAGLAKYVSPSDPNEMKATSTTLSYVPGKQGQAVSLSTGQYVDFGTAGYPKAGPLDTLGDIRGAGYEKTGFGRGMDQGSILCWVKPNSTGVIYGNANTNAAPGTDDTHFGLSTTSTNNARIIVRGENYDGGYQEIGTASGGLNMTGFSLQDGQWHMFAATWENDTVRVYINGEQVATNTAGTPEKYNPWERGNLLGVSRTANRWILSSADFLTGAIDSLRVYNYVISAGAIATEYKTLSGNTPCANHSFTGSAYNFDNTASSYCKVDIGDFVMFASQWLNCGLYPDCP